MHDRHKKIFQKDEYVFVASDELVMSMTYEFVSKLKLDKWTKLESDWLLKATKIIRDAEKSSIECFQLVQIIPKNGASVCDRETVYRVQLSSSDTSWHYVTGKYLQDLLCDDEWNMSELDCLTLSGSNMLITLSLGARKKDDVLCTKTKDEFWGIACGD